MFYPDPHPISIVVSSLKRYEDVNSAPTVAGLDVDAFTVKCTPCSASYDASFCEFDVNEKWANRQLLHSFIIRFASLHGCIAQLQIVFNQCS